VWPFMCVAQMCVAPLFTHVCGKNVFGPLLTHVCGPQGTVRETVQYFQKIDSNVGAWGKTVMTVDASASTVFAERWCQNSYQQMKEYVEDAGPDAIYHVTHVPCSHSMFYVGLLRLPNPVSDRVFSTWFTWRKEADGSFVIAFAPLSDYNQSNSSTVEINNALSSDPSSANAVPGKLRGYWRIKPLAPSVCQLTYLLQAELGGSIPSALLNSRLKSSLARTMQTIQAKFVRNGKVVDEELRASFAPPPALAELTEEQSKIVQTCEKLAAQGTSRKLKIPRLRSVQAAFAVASAADTDSEWEPLTSPSPFVTMWIKHTLAKRGERSIALGKATAVIDCSALVAASELSPPHTHTHIHTPLARNLEGGVNKGDSPHTSLLFPCAAPSAFCSLRRPLCLCVGSWLRATGSGRPAHCVFCSHRSPLCSHVCVAPTCSLKSPPFARLQSSCSRSPAESR